jgi:hypothetical protein
LGETYNELEADKYITKVVKRSALKNIHILRCIFLFLAKNALNELLKPEKGKTLFKLIILILKNYIINA